MLTEDIQLGYRIAKVGDKLIEESQNKHALRSRLCHELDGTLKAVVEPVQNFVTTFPERYNSAILTGDTASAMLSLLGYCIAWIHTGKELTSISKSYVNLIKRSTKYQQNAVVHLAMSSFGLSIYLSAQTQVELNIKSYDELNAIGASTQNLQLLHQNLINEMSCYFWMRDYIKVAQLSAKFKPTGHKRILQVVRIFFEGIAYLTLARHTRQPNWRKTGEEALEKIKWWAQVSNWNFENMKILLEAELHYLNGDLKLANTSYKAAIVSAHSHRYLHYEALSFELYGIFCIENQAVDKGVEQLRLALERYTQWGAKRKVEALQEFIDLVDTKHLQNKLKIRI